jgi:hypothetical protein
VNVNANPDDGLPRIRWPRVRFYDEGGKVMFEFITQSATSAFEDGDRIIREVRTGDSEAYPSAWARYVATLRKGSK